MEKSENLQGELFDPESILSHAPTNGKSALGIETKFINQREMPDNEKNGAVFPKSDNSDPESFSAVQDIEPFGCSQNPDGKANLDDNENLRSRDDIKDSDKMEDEKNIDNSDEERAHPQTEAPGCEIIVIPDLIEENGYGIPEPGKFPVDTLPAVIRHSAETISNIYNTPIELSGMGGLLTQSGAIAKAYIVKGASVHALTSCNLYALVGAPPGFGKQAIHPMIKPMLDASAQFKKDWIEKFSPRMMIGRSIAKHELRSFMKMIHQNMCNHPPITEVELQNAIEKMTLLQARIQKYDNDLVCEPALHTGNATGAALSQLVNQGDGGIFYVSGDAGDAIKILLGRFTGNTDLDIFLKGYSVEDVAEDRIVRKRIRAVGCLSCFWVVQPHILHELIKNKEAWARGLLARMIIFSCQRETVPSDAGMARNINEAAMTAWNEHINNILQIRFANNGTVAFAGQKAHIIQSTSEAKAVFDDYHNESVMLQNGAFRDFRDLFTRWRENAIRICGNLAVGIGTDTITGEMAQQAVKLGRWCQRSTLQSALIYMKEHRKSRADKLIRDLQANGGEMTVRDLARRHCITEAEVSLLSAVIPGRIVIQTLRHLRGGRPSKIIKLVNLEIP